MNPTAWAPPWKDLSETYYDDEYSPGRPLHRVRISGRKVRGSRAFLPYEPVALVNGD